MLNGTRLAKLNFNVICTHTKNSNTIFEKCTLHVFPKIPFFSNYHIITNMEYLIVFIY